MSANIIGALLVRNEAAPDRYLKRVLANVKEYCDGIVVVDDGSTDDTVAVCREAGAYVITTRKPSAEGWWSASDMQNETQARKLLWERAAEHAGPEGWLYLADADHLLQGLSPAEFRRLTRASLPTTCFSFPLWDCWESETLQRVDGYWQAWAHPRPWFFRARPAQGYNPVWSGRAIHAGHAPSNYPLVSGLVPCGAGIAHLGYVKAAHRTAKRARYLALA